MRKFRIEYFDFTKKSGVIMKFRKMTENGDERKLCELNEFVYFFIHVKARTFE